MPELILIFVIALLVFGPQELPKLAKNLGRVMAEFKRTSDDLMHQVQRELDSVEAEEAKAAEPAAPETISPPADPSGLPPLVPDPDLEKAAAGQDGGTPPAPGAGGEAVEAGTEAPGREGPVAGEPAASHPAEAAVPAAPAAAAEAVPSAPSGGGKDAAPPSQA